MNRRGFLQLLGGIALSEAIPFNRVWSFPKKIVIAEPKIVEPVFDLDLFPLNAGRGIEGLAQIYYGKHWVQELRRNPRFPMEFSVPTVARETRALREKP